MDFGLSDEQELLQSTVRGFVENECPAGRLRELFDAGTGHDDALWTGLVEMGLPGLTIPEEYGGAGMEILDLALVCEVLGTGGVPSPFLGHVLASLALDMGGSPAQKSRWLPGLADGSRRATWALCEAGSGWEPETWHCRWAEDSISGTKLYVPHADGADLLVVGVEGSRLAVVDTAGAGVRIENLEGIDRSRPVFRVDFEGAPCELLADDPAVARRLRDAGLVLLAADAFGAASHLIDLAVEYAKTREQFGQKIAQFQAVKHQLARLGLDIEPTRALFWHAAYAVDHLPEEAERAAALAKAHITDRGLEVARAVVELHGGLGFTWECDVQMGFKRLMFDRAFLGNPESLRDRCAALAGW
ncbi:MAG TPA: acyl-CoA dehydrogenase [Myxococcales bacterium]|nr:acyl-CoA dehydrogenase [Myxococcales bacterium]HIL01358.1 acyl-CoA dehydrogenase [Myxococcales bacterium]